MEIASFSAEFPLVMIPFATSIVLVMGSPDAEPAQPRTSPGLRGGGERLLRRFDRGLTYVVAFSVSLEGQAAAVERVERGSVTD
jgi:hypothetical protein